MARLPSLNSESPPGAHQPLSQAEGLALCQYARERIGARLGGPMPVAPQEPELRATGATFVTLRWPDGELQGCVGSLEAYLPLWQDVDKNAQSAAFRDPRGQRLSAPDVNRLQVEVSVLSPLTPMHFSGEADAVRQLRPGVDGVVLSSRGRRGTFLPQVWESMSGSQEFLCELKQKAGFPADYWAEDLSLQRYGVDKYIAPPLEDGGPP